MSDVTKDLIAAIEAAFREGFRSPTTYNDTVLNLEDEEWEKSDAKAAIARAEAALAAPQPDALEKARAEEREACAKVCDELAHEWRGANSRIVECAAAIRARGEKP